MGYGLLCTPTNYSPYIFLFIQLHLLWPLMHSNKLFPLYLLIASTPPPMDSYGLPASFCYHYSCSSILIYSTPPPMASYALQQIIPLISSYCFNSTSHGLLWTPSFFLLSLFLFVYTHLFNSTSYGLLCTPTNYSPYIFLLLQLHLPWTPMDSQLLFVIIIPVRLYSFIQLHPLWPPMHSSKLFPLYLLIASTPTPMDSYGLPASFCYHY